jgi:hypothetical protein
MLIQTEVSKYDGTLGCIAKIGNEVALLSAAHVLFAGARQRQGIKVLLDASSTCCTTQIATTIGSWKGGFRPAAGNSFDTDCALALLAPGTQYDNTLPGGIGMIAGTPPKDQGVVKGPELGTPPTPQQLVRFYSREDGEVRYGTLISGTGGTLRHPNVLSDPSDAREDILPHSGQFWVMPRATPGSSGSKLSFGKKGDSGSIVVNASNQVVGMLVRNLPRPPIGGPGASTPEWLAVENLGVVTPIWNVLEHLGITIPSGLSGAVPTSGGARIVVPSFPVDPEEAAFERGRDRLRDALNASRMGRLVLGKMALHRREVNRIVQGVREAKVTWHALQGPAFLEHVRRALRDPVHPIPTTVNGVERARLVEAMGALLLRHGGARLRRDVLRYRGIVLRHGAGITGVDQIAPLLRDTPWRAKRATAPAVDEAA